MNDAFKIQTALLFAVFILSTIGMIHLSVGELRWHLNKNRYPDKGKDDTRQFLICSTAEALNYKMKEKEVFYRKEENMQKKLILGTNYEVRNRRSILDA